MLKRDNIILAMAATAEPRNVQDNHYLGCLQKGSLIHGMERQEWFDHLPDGILSGAWEKEDVIERLHCIDWCASRLVP